MSRLCENCRWYRKSDLAAKYDKCARPNRPPYLRLAEVERPDLVRSAGDQQERPIFCDFDRADGWVFAFLMGSCGTRGRFWKPRQTDEGNWDREVV